MGHRVPKLPFLTPKREKGREYFYYRRGGRWYALPAPTDPSFQIEYERLHTSFELKAEVTELGTFGWVAEQYFQSPDYKDKAMRTQKDYRQIIDRICKTWRDRAMVEITRAGVFKYRDSLRHSPRQANYAVQVIRLLFSFAIDRGVVRDNPALRPKRLKEGEGHKPWSDASVAQFREANKDSEMMLTALDIALCTGLRQGDLCKLSSAHYQDGQIKIPQGKTGDMVSIRVHPTLKSRLDAIEERPYMIVTKTGKQFTESHLRQKWRQATLKAGLDGLTFHGLRTTAGTYLAEAGCSDAEIQSVLGHRTPTQAAHYRRFANQEKMAAAAMVKLKESRPII